MLNSVKSALRGKLKKMFLVFTICLFVCPVLIAAGLPFGMTGAVKEKVKELDEKVREKEAVTTIQPPAQVTTPTPADGATNVPINQQLSWTAASGATTYDVYFGMTSPGTLLTNTAGTSYDPGALSYSATYYWRIDSKNAGGTTTGVVWIFTTTPQPPAQVTTPAPADGATNIPINQQLSWTAASDATTYDVYFGTTSPGTLMGNQPGTSYNPGALSYSTTYYWRIDSKNAGGTTTGVVWSFTTQLPPAVAPTVFTSSATTITHNSATLTGTVNPNGLATTAKFEYGVTIAYSSNTADISAGSGSTFAPVTSNLSSLTPFTAYNYRVTASNSAGTTDGANRTFNTPISPPSTAQLLIDEGFNPVIATPDGVKIYAVYAGAIGTSGGDGIVFQKSINGGVAFDSKVNISRGSNGDAGQLPSITIDLTGGIHVAYTRPDSAGYHTYYSKSTDEGANFSVPVKISDAITDSSQPRIDVTATDVYVVWGGDDARIYIDKSSLSTVAFGTDKMVNTVSIGTHSQPSIATGSNNVYVVWMGRDSGTSSDNKVFLAKSTNDAATFSDRVRVDDDFLGGTRPRISVSGTNVYVVWEADYNIRLRVSLDAGATFASPSIKVNINSSYSNNDHQFVNIKNDAKGTIYLIWSDGGFGTTADIYYAYASTNNTQLVISANRKVNSAAGKSGCGHQRPALAIGGGKIFTIWRGSVADVSLVWNIYFSMSN